ncbi:Gfo/Idh/MocA family protein [Leeuwenhoekiella sp. A16]|uniref:Gfo/Idh/MocA family protein n=1 Tax=unclassified Leeuwenhoekiella TaxID=2615029 RepID=UPI003A801175
MRLLIVIICTFFTSTGYSQDLLNVAVVGLSHDHAHVIMNEYKQHKVNIVGIAESDQNLIDRYTKSYNIPDSLFYSSVEEMLAKVKPDAVLAYNPISEHIDVARICLPMQLPLMVEKPLAINSDQAQEMAALSRKHNTPLLTNYETTWYGSNQTLKDKVTQSDFGIIKKMIARDGHEGPKEIGCSKEFLSWLTDPEKNGGGAVIDFGCYGANLMTWLQNGEKPIAVTAVTRNFKPDVYPKVDDDATIILEYEHATGVIQASWDWSYSLKDLQVYGTSSSYEAVDGNTLKYSPKHTKIAQIDLKTDYYQDHLTYLKAVLDGKINTTDDLSSLENNLIVVEILDAAKKSAKTGKKVML